ncbi:MAG TPA: NifB/NifX family molybdenum-iron cluster-binding protein, partial [Methylomicrobium sp.]|nr:NifB/NifX family molybdenum-iron cluster-binding protein [Methylomicrobium sp.]
LPQVLSYKDGDMPESIRIAIASNTGSLLNGHFGSCIRFLVYQLSREDCRLIDIRSTVEADSAEDRNQFRVNLIQDCQLLFVQSIGGPAAAKVIRGGIYPVKVPEVIDAAEKLREFRNVFDAPPPWLAKVLGKSPEERKRLAVHE